MAKRWVGRVVVGAFLAGLWPGLAHAQGYPDPVPIGRAGGVMTAGMPWPGYGGPPTQVSYPAPPPYAAEPMPGGHAAAPTRPPGHGPWVGPWLPTLPDAPCRHDQPCDDFWEDDDCPHFLITAGWMGLWRRELKHGALAVVDPVPFDDGQPPPVNAPLAVDFHDLDMNLQSGLRASAALYMDNFAAELAGFYMWPTTSREDFIRVGQLSSFFFNPPLGFEGTNASLWDNADLIRLSLRTTLGNAEVNARWFTGWDCTEFELLAGFRYVDLQERLDIITSDDQFQLVPVPETIATYTTRTHNHLIGGQLGFAVRQPIGTWLSLSYEARGAWFGNHADIDMELIRGDGLVGRRGGQEKWDFAQLYEGGAFFDINGCRWRVRLGYQVMWILGVATARTRLISTSKTTAAAATPTAASSTTAPPASSTSSGRMAARSASNACDGYFGVPLASGRLSAGASRRRDQYSIRSMRVTMSTTLPSATASTPVLPASRRR